jgi:hypothetical protein
MSSGPRGCWAGPSEEPAPRPASGVNSQPPRGQKAEGGTGTPPTPTPTPTTTTTTHYPLRHCHSD